MVRERNANYEQIVRQLTFRRKPWFAGGNGWGEEGEGTDELDVGVATRRRLAVAEGGAEGGWADGRVAGWLAGWVGGWAGTLAALAGARSCGWALARLPVGCSLALQCCRAGLPLPPTFAHSCRRRPAMQSSPLPPRADARSEEEGSEGPGALAEGEELIAGEGVRNAKLLLWMGDFNYR